MTNGIVASVVIALNPHEEDFAPVLAAYERQTAPLSSFELVVVDPGTRPQAAAAIADLRRSHSRLCARSIPSERAGRAAANNAGARAAKSDLVMFVADDFVPSPTLVRAHIEFHRHAAGRVVGIGPGLFTESLREDPFRRWLEDSGLLFGMPFRMAENRWPHEFFYVGNASMRRSLFDALGGFDEAFEHDLLDDFEFSRRLSGAGARTHFLCKARAWHEHRVTLAERAQAQRRCGQAARRLSERYASVAQWKRLCDRPLEELRVAAGRAEELESRSSTPETRAARFQALLDLAFAEGFRSAAPDAAETSAFP